jgi:methyl-accepting chemotaxis protein
VNSVKRVTDIIAEISAASQEQAIGIDQVNKAIMSMDQTTQQNVGLVEATTSSAQAMQQQAQGLFQQVAVFKVNGTGDAFSVKLASTQPALMSPRGVREAPMTRGGRLEGGGLRPKPSASNLKPPTLKRTTHHAAGPAVGASVSADKGASLAEDGFEEF